MDPGEMDSAMGEWAKENTTLYDEDIADTRMDSLFGDFDIIDNSLQDDPLGLLRSPLDNEEDPDFGFGPVQPTVNPPIALTLPQAGDAVQPSLPQGPEAAAPVAAIRTERAPPNPPTPVQTLPQNEVPVEAPPATTYTQSGESVDNLQDFDFGQFLEEDLDISSFADIPLPDMPFFNPVPLDNTGLEAASAVPTSYISQQQAMPSPSTAFASLPVHMPRPARQEHSQLITTSRVVTPVPQQPYMAQPQQTNTPPVQPLMRHQVVTQPQHMIRQQTYPVQPAYPSLQQAPQAPRVATPGFGNAYGNTTYGSPPASQTRIPQMVAKDLRPQQGLHIYSPPYGAAPMAQSPRKRMAPADDDSDDLPRPARKIRHRRDGNRRPSNEASRFYKPLPHPPVDWSPPTGPSTRGRNPGHVFRYSEHGELLGNHTFSAEQLRFFLMGPSQTGAPPPRTEKLTVWIQQTPAYAIHRYGPDCSVCRWDNCPVKRNTISKGQFRVALDEHAATSGKTTDPFRVAGYMHLFCFEEVFNMHNLIFGCSDRVTVKPDRRVFRHEEKNPMALGPELLRALGEWERSEGAKLNVQKRNGVRNPQTPRERRLWRALTKEVLRQPGYVEGLEKRNEIHIGRYVGDLRMYQAMVDERLERQREARRGEVVEEDEDEDCIIVSTPAAARAPRRVARRLSDPRYTPPPTPEASRKRGRADENGVPNPASPTKRSKFNPPEVVTQGTKKAVREALKGTRYDEKEVDRVARTMAAWAPAVAAMPQHMRLEVEGLVMTGARRLREGEARRCNSAPAG